MTKPIMNYLLNGDKVIKVYRVNDVYHRDPLEGPALIHYDENGDINVESYFVNGKLHNPYGLAYLDYGFNIYDWYFNYKKCTNEVNEYLDKHNLRWQNMSHIDFDIMWMNIL